MDDRGYPIEASYPAGWTATRPRALDPVTQAILNGVPALSLRAGGPDVQTVIVPGRPGNRHHPAARRLRDRAGRTQP